MLLIVSHDSSRPFNGFGEVPERQQPVAGWVTAAETRILDQGRFSRSQVTYGPVAKPAAIGFHVETLRDRELRSGTLDEAAKAIRGPCSAHWVHDTPAISQ